MKAELSRYIMKNVGKDASDTANNDPSNHWCRLIMDKETDKLVRKLNLHDFEVLEISGEKWSDFGFKTYQSRSFPEFNICNEVLENKFDLIIAEQVFEHLLYPYRSAKNVYQMLKEGGYFLVSTPFLIKYHPMPADCTRWTETGIKYFLNEVGFDLEKIKTGSWGNKECLIENLDEWKEYDKRHHSLENEKDFPMVVWALAGK